MQIELGAELRRDRLHHGDGLLGLSGLGEQPGELRLGREPPKRLRVLLQEPGELPHRRVGVAELGLHKRGPILGVGPGAGVDLLGLLLKLRRDVGLAHQRIGGQACLQEDRRRLLRVAGELLDAAEAERVGDRLQRPRPARLLLDRRDRPKDRGDLLAEHLLQGRLQRRGIGRKE